MTLNPPPPTAPTTITVALRSVRLTLIDHNIKSYNRKRTQNKTKVFSVKLHLDLKFWSNQNKVKFIFISHLDKCCMDKCHSETYPLILILLVRSMRQKCIWSKQCWSNNIEAKKKHLVPKNFSKIIFLSTKNFFNPKFLGTQKFFLTKNRLWTPKFLEQKFSF